MALVSYFDNRIENGDLPWGKYGDWQLLKGAIATGPSLNNDAYLDLLRKLKMRTEEIDEYKSYIKELKTKVSIVPVSRNKRLPNGEIVSCIGAHPSIEASIALYSSSIYSLTENLERKQVDLQRYMSAKRFINSIDVQYIFELQSLCRRERKELKRLQLIYEYWRAKSEIKTYTDECFKILGMLLQNM